MLFRRHAVFFVLCGICLAQTPIHTIRGQNGFDLAGAGLAVLGDLNQDGVQDFLYGERGFDGVAGLNCGRVTAVSGFDQTVIYQVEGPTAGELFGANLAGLGDITGDGVDDWISGSQYGGPNGANSGVARVVNGATGSVLWTHFGAPDTSGDGFGAYLGYTVSGGGDVDGDGTPDYLIGGPGDYYSGEACPSIDQVGFVAVRSGATGAPIHVVLGASACMNAGVSGAIIADLNGDGRSEFLMGIPTSTTAIGFAEVRSGLDGSVLRTHPGPNVGDGFGRWVNGLGDLDGDFVPDYGVSGGFSSGVGASPGYVRLYSGATGTLILQLSGNVSGDVYGSGFSDAGDWNGDGVDDLLVSAPFDPTNGFKAGRVAVVSGVDGSSFLEILGEAPLDELGSRRRAQVIQDLEGDGKPEILTSTPLNDRYGTDRGMVTLHSSQTRTHWLSQSLLSIAAPGLVEFEVQGPAGGLYAILGSLTGTSPPTVIGPFIIPLSPDPWFNLTLDPAATPIANGVGLLDLQGRGTGAFALPPGLPPAFAGLTHWSVGVTVDAVAGVTISQPAAFTLAP